MQADTKLEIDACKQARGVGVFEIVHDVLCGVGGGELVVRAVLVNAKNSHHAIAKKLVDDSTEPHDRGRKVFEEVVGSSGDRFWIAALAHSGESANIREHEGEDHASGRLHVAKATRVLTQLRDNVGKIVNAIAEAVETLDELR